MVEGWLGGEAIDREVAGTKAPGTGGRYLARLAKTLYASEKRAADDTTQ